MTALELLVDFHKCAQRQGPGSAEDTLKALSFIPFKKSDAVKVADIGCGTGAQTFVIAQQLNAEITAVDIFPDFLEKINSTAKTKGLEGKIKTLQASMDELPFKKNEFDLIWSEGAIYNMGFESGIKNWKNFLKTGGYLAVSEITWTTQTRPQVIENHWKNEYPEVNTASQKLSVLENNGFSPVGYFYFPEKSWVNHYYQPIENRIQSFLAKHHFSEQAKELVNQELQEIKMYKTYKDYYSYGFYIAKKTKL